MKFSAECPNAKYTYLIHISGNWTIISAKTLCIPTNKYIQNSQKFRIL